MQLPTLLPTLLLALSLTLPSAFATCLLDKDATRVACNFATYFSALTEEVVNKTMAIDFTDQMNSVCWLISNGTDCPCKLGTTTLSSRRAFLNAQATQPNLPFVVMNTWHDCSNVFIRWNFDVKPEQVQGIAVLQKILNPDVKARAQESYLIKNVFSEFNSGAFAVNRGDFRGTPPPQCTNPRKRKDSGMSGKWMVERR